MKFYVALIAVLLAAVFAQKVTDEVIRELSLKGNHASIFIEFEEQVDFTKTTKNGVAVEDLDEITQGRFVLSELMGTALVAQQSVKSFLTQHGIKFHSYYIDNTIFAEKVPKNLIDELINFDNVKLISSNPEVNFELETGYDVNITKAQVEWNVAHVKAPQVWAQGFKGKGIIISNSDTGVSWNEPALKKQYAGNQGGNVNHDYHWMDGSNVAKTPVDGHGHGTHCMGTKVGEDGVNKIGMAPAATWTACRSLGPGASRATVLKCLEWFLAPTDVNGRNPKPDKRPHITSHSYLCNGCSLDTAVKNLKAAGVAVVVANGNSGPRCQSVTHPASVKESFSVGALAPQSDNIASFSSRGPVTNYIKPNIAAPGQNVRSCVPGGRYQSMSGTSMAAPAVAGCFALLWDAVPELKRKVEQSEKVFQDSALKQRANNQCNSDAAPNNVFGWGTINVEKAVELAKKIYRKD